MTEVILGVDDVEGQSSRRLADPPATKTPADSASGPSKDATTHQLITREPGFAKHMVDIEPQLAFTGDNLPLLLNGLARMSGEGSYANGYVCDLNVAGFFPGLNDLTTFIVNAATPGNANPITPQNLGQHTPRCSNLAHG
jgi:phospholipid/cholesterol/gamma-HCH transport system substrate-binding protein